MIERVVDRFAGVYVKSSNQMRLGVESHQRRLASGVGQKQVEERAQLGELVEFEHADAALFDGDHQRHRRRVHLFLHANLLRDAVVFENKVALLEAVDNSAASLSQPVSARGLR
jgi:hypothetical protein